MAATSFKQKQLRATLTLPGTNQTFPGTNSNQLVLTNLRMVATLTFAGNYTNHCDLQIYGMRQTDMNAVTILWANPNPTAFKTQALLLLEANDGNNGWVTVFTGQFLQASPDYHSLPDVCLSINAASGLAEQLASTAPNGFTGATDVATIASTLATQMGLTLETNGVQATLNTPYFAGTLLDQFRQLCSAAYLDYYFTTDGNLAITMRNQPRVGKQSVLLSKSTGLIGYPTIIQFGISVQCLWTPAIALGCPVQITSDVPGANGTWFPQRGVHQLDSNKPGGSWLSSFDCQRYSGTA